MTESITLDRGRPNSVQGAVGHFDELSDAAMDCLIQFCANERGAGVTGETAAELSAYDCIKYVEYVTISSPG